MLEKPWTTEKDRARRLVRKALRQGTLKRPKKCEHCGRSGKASDGRAYIHAHHYKGYTRPLDVQWLCPLCHFEYDPRASGEANGRAKLTNADVAAIRRNYRPAKNQHGNENAAPALAKKYGVVQTTILEIVWGRHWTK